MKTACFALLLISSTVLAQQSGTDHVRMTIPGIQGALELSVGSITWETRVRDDGIETQMRAMDRPDHVVISAFLQKVEFSASAEKCRDDWWSATEKGYKSHGLKMEHMDKSSNGAIARVEFFVPEFQGKKVKQQILHAYLGSGNLCAEVHLSKINFAPDDQKLFEEVLKTVRLLPNEAATQAPDKSSFDYVAEGSKFYFQRNFSAAIGPYEKALAMEKQKRTLQRNVFIVLVDNLGYAYAVNGNIPKSMDTLRYGLSVEPEYPLFHYNLACGYGELTKLDESLEELRLAFKYRANMFPGERFPDPLKDSSFKKFLSDKKFVDAIQQMQQEP